METIIEQLTYKIALPERHKFAKRSEQISPAQASLLDNLLDLGLEAIEAELNQILPASSPARPRQSPKRAPLPPQLPGTVIRHEAEDTQCAWADNLNALAEKSRQARLHAGYVCSRATRAWQMGLPSVRNPDSGARSGSGHR